MSDDELDFCVLCGRSPCVWEMDRQQMVDAFNRRYGEIPVEGSVEERREAQKERRHYMYRFYINLMYGILGRRVRVQLPECITGRIRRLAPDPNSNYVGFRDV